MPRFAFNPFTGTLDIAGAIADVIDGVFLTMDGDYLVTPEGDYLAFN